MTSVEKAPTQKSQDYEEPVAYKGTYSPESGRSSLEHVLEDLRFAPLDGSPDERHFGDLVDVYWNTKPQVENDPTGPLVLADALANISHINTPEERDKMEKIYLDSLDQVKNKLVDDPELASISSLIVGIRVVDKMTTKKHKEQALETVEGILGSLEEATTVINPDTGKQEHAEKIDQNFRDAASRGLREYRGLLDQNIPASLEKIVSEEINAISNTIIHRSESTRAKTGRTVSSQTDTNEIAQEIPHLSSQEIEDLREEYAFAIKRDQRRMEKWDKFYEDGGDPMSIGQQADPGYNSRKPAPRPPVDSEPDSTGAILGFDAYRDPADQQLTTDEIREIALKGVADLLKKKAS